jgi:hypothetical protein
MVTIADPATIPGVQPLPPIAAPLPVVATPAGWRTALAQLEAGGGSERLLVRGRARPCWPDARQIAALAEAGVEEIGVARPLRFTVATAPGALGFLRFLRDCASEGIAVRWRGELEATVPVALLTHLPPPEALDGRDEAALRTWQAGYRYGACYWRQGPDFVTLCDTRAGRAAQRLTLDSREELRVFAALQRPMRLARRRSAAWSAALAALEEEGMVLELGGWALSLPTRMRRWPVPASAL